MRCEEFKNRIFDSDSVLNSHAESCGVCADLRDTIRREGRLLARAEAPVAPANLWSQIESSIRSQTRLRRATAFGWLSAAAALLIAVIGVVVFRNRPGVKTEPAEAAKPKPTITLHVVDVPAETARGFSGIVPSYDGMDGREVVVSAVLPNGSRRSP